MFDAGIMASHSCHPMSLPIYLQKYSFPLVAYTNLHMPILHYLPQAAFVATDNTTVVTGPRMMHYIRNTVLAHKPGTTYTVVNDWIKAGRNLQILQLTVILQDKSVFGSNDNIRQYGPLTALLNTTKRLQVEQAKR